MFYGGVNVKTHKDLLKNECPHIVVGTPGRILALTRDKDLSLKSVRHFILDECDKMLESLGMCFRLCNCKVISSDKHSFSGICIDPYLATQISGNSYQRESL